MIRPPFAARVAAGIAATVVEEVQKLPTTAVTLPMTTVSQVLQTSMRIQQSMTALAIKGDEALAILFHTTEEQPQWATFDEDLEPPATNGAVSGSPSANTKSPSTDAKPANQGRFELYSMSPPVDAPAKAPAPAKTRTAAPAKPAAPVERPEIAEYLDYDNLTLAQLRARLRTLSVDELESLLAYENGSLGRAPFQTMLGNRITTANSK
ncbi:lipid droplet-associated protein [Rhodococcus spelaei]|uniref:Lipid droplet-associated protein n=1 Tax=Rhodococcus spelaei TaxID=2546320 RepID=A0A541BNL8_9NOCA|nr:lipid droplet-associated protein [Rhodococcus spelaei]TQF73894.1 lipid droplet-associated protein [Rhodococcus spelaei]